MGSDKEKYKNETNFVSNLLVKTVQRIGGQTSAMCKYYNHIFYTLEGQLKILIIDSNEGLNFMDIYNRDIFSQIDIKGL